MSRRCGGRARARPCPACTGPGRPGRTARPRWPPRPSVEPRPGPRRPRRRPRPSGRAGRGGSCGSSRCRRRRAPAARRGSPPTWARSPQRDRGRRVSGTVNQKVLPTPSSLSTPISPPIAATSWREMASPSPVPPYLRVVEESACEKVSKSRARRLRRRRRCRCRTPRSGPPADRRSRSAEPGPDDHLALGGELHRVAGQVEQHLADPGRVAAQRGRQVRRAVGEQLQVLGAGRLADQLGDALHERPRGRSRSPRGQGGRTRSWRSRGSR